MLRIMNDPTRCSLVPHDTHPAGPSVLPALWSALREALSGSRAYRSLRSQGLPHDAAIRHALGIDANQTHLAKPPPPPVVPPAHLRPVVLTG